MGVCGGVVVRSAHLVALTLGVMSSCSTPPVGLGPGDMDAGLSASDAGKHEPMIDPTACAMNDLGTTGVFDPIFPSRNPIGTDTTYYAYSFPIVDIGCVRYAGRFELEHYYLELPGTCTPGPDCTATKGVLAVRVCNRCREPVGTQWRKDEFPPVWTPTSQSDFPLSFQQANYGYHHPVLGLAVEDRHGTRLVTGCDITELIDFNPPLLHESHPVREPLVLEPGVVSVLDQLLLSRHDQTWNEYFETRRDLGLEHRYWQKPLDLDSSLTLLMAVPRFRPLSQISASDPIERPYGVLCAAAGFLPAPGVVSELDEPWSASDLLLLSGPRPPFPATIEQVFRASGARERAR